MNTSPSRLSVHGILLGLALTTPQLSAQTKSAPEVPHFREGFLLVKPKPGAPPGLLDNDHAAIRARTVRVFASVGNLELVNLPPGLPVDIAAQHYRSRGNVEYVEPDFVVNVVAPVTPADPNFSTLWGLHNTGQTGGIPDADIDAPEAWEVRRDAGTVVVGVIDTGIDYTHPDLAANLWVNSQEIPGDGVDNDGNGFVDDVYGINAISNSGDPRDDHYHGTHVAGTIGARGNNNIGVTGVAWTVKLMALKFLDAAGSGFTSDAIECIEYAVDHGAKVLNNSWGGGGYSQSLFDAILAARSAGVLFVAAAGNSSNDNDTLAFYPAGYQLDNVVSVAATDHADALAGFSNFGYLTVLLGAPGVSINSTYPNNGYSSLNGTSMASPHVAGALALLKAQFPLATHQQLIHRLLGTVDVIPSLETKTLSGGRLNLHKALVTPDPIRPIALLTATPPAGEPPLQVEYEDRSLGSITSRTLDFGDGTGATSTTTGSHLYQSAGVFHPVLTVSGPGGVSVRSLTVVVADNYAASDVTYSWVSTTGMTSLAMGDDTVSAPVSLPFSFPFYGGQFNAVFISSNGKLLFGSNEGGTAYGNSDIPSAFAPNNAVYCYWDDLNPAVGGSVRHGTTPSGDFVVSWESVPHYMNSQRLFSFQAILLRNGDIKIQFKEVNPADASLGAGRSATVGVEHGTGYIARRHTFNGSRILANSEAVLFSLGSSPPPNQPPTAPSNLLGSPACDTDPSQGAIRLTWQDNSNNEDGFRIEWSPEQGGSWTYIGANVSGTSYTQTGLGTGETRRYRVRAENTAGPSAWSSTATASTYRIPAGPPSLVDAVTVSASQIRIDWSVVPNASGYLLERSTGGLPYSVIANPAAGTSTYTDGNLAAGTTYSYRILAAGPCSFLTGPSNPDSATTQQAAPAAPAAPSNLSAQVISRSEIQLTWTDRSTNESGFYIEVSSPRTPLSRITIGANTSSSNTMSHSVSGLLANTKYTFRVQAFNSTGSSAYSNTASGKTSR